MGPGESGAQSSQPGTLRVAAWVGLEGTQVLSVAEATASPYKLGVTPTFHGGVKEKLCLALSSFLRNHSSVCIPAGEQAGDPDLANFLNSVC